MAPQRSQQRGAVWAHLYLLLGEMVLALRERQTRGDESTDDDAAPLLGSAESQDGDLPPGDGAVALPVWTKGGCRPLQKNGCAWLQCKHEEYKTGLLAQKYQNETEAKAEIHRRRVVMLAEDWPRFVENKFLVRRETGHFLFKAMGYRRKGILLDCSWALADGAESFEGWLQQLLPWRYACVNAVVSTFKPERQLCVEGFTNYFKEKLYDSCEPEGSSDRNPYKLHDRKIRRAAALSLVGTGTVSVATGMGMVVGLVGMLSVAGMAVLAAVLGLLLTGTVALAAVELANLYCKGRKKMEQKKHAVRELSPSSQ